MTSCLLLLLLLPLLLKMTSTVPRATVLSVSTDSVSALGRYQRHLPIIVVSSDFFRCLAAGRCYDFKKFTSVISKNVFNRQLIDQLV